MVGGAFLEVHSIGPGVLVMDSSDDLARPPDSPVWCLPPTVPSFAAAAIPARSSAGRIRGTLRSEVSFEVQWNQTVGKVHGEVVVVPGAFAPARMGCLMLPDDVGSGSV